MLSVITLGLRALQVVLSVVVLGLAVTMIKDQVYGDSPTTTRYSTFTGGFGVIVALLGVAGLFVSAIPELIILGIDAVCGILFAAGGIAWAVGLKGISCTSQEDATKMLANGLLNQGTLKKDGTIYYGVVQDDSSEDAIWGKLKGNCQKGMADEIIQFLCFAVALGLVGLGFVRMKKGGKTSAYV